MSAREKVSLTPAIKKLGIIAGGGTLPEQLAETCKAQNIETYVIGLKNQTDFANPNFTARIGAGGKIKQYLLDNAIHDVVLIGAVKRPTIFNLWPDWQTFKFFLSALFKPVGDSKLLDKLRQRMEQEGITIHGVHKFLPKLLMPEGVIGEYLPPDRLQLDIQKGLKESQELGMEDKGQAVIIKAGRVLGRENKLGTSALIKKHGAEGAILVKTCKPQQDKDLDLPTIGPETARLCQSKKMAGIVGQAGATLLVERDKTVRIADTNGLFILGVSF